MRGPRALRRPARLSVRMRATLAATGIVAVALGVAAAVLVGVLRANLQTSAAAEAARRAEAAADLLVAAPGVVGVDPDVQIVPFPAETPAPAPVPSVAPAPWAPDGAFVQVATPVAVAGRELVVWARASLQPAAAALDALTGLLVPGIPALLLLVAGLTWLAVGRALAPVAAIRRELADITATDLHRRVPVPAARDEIAALAVTTNATLDRLENAVGRHQRFVADAAHELRSPLAVLRARLELAPPQPLTAEALADVDRIQRLAADLLLLARLDAGAPPARRLVDLGQVVAEEAARPRGRADVRVALRVEPGVVVIGDAEQLRRLVANLVDNGVRHARSSVAVQLGRVAGMAVLDVIDDGAGIAMAAREAVFDRFTRLDEARTRDTGGCGLGLAIAREVAIRHGGHLRVVGGPPGAHLQARIPLAAYRAATTEALGAVSARRPAPARTRPGRRVALGRPRPASGRTSPE
jgi:signal transduction histidine kinase